MERHCVDWSPLAYLQGTQSCRELSRTKRSLSLPRHTAKTPESMATPSLAQCSSANRLQSPSASHQHADVYSPCARLFAIQI
ncbi:uncharacterized protein L969DRAFT_87866 [Mixia osmundae IAM 14324]|uniref:uncharacterized protein n=1 Tax=Mixia osmundae (strain CBS 9802 / IAM 14324 / JCM 22182 / KY 12970) TaxID=764103 RepID=UPI0004A54C65|nr:uncharacterized protein L969DRAFT_87866 [Mixia osmundae IAM 14324]KEI38649.1 hypothetical protein L969DRAFT_87866 [Mixia osmundae IAM 14324]